MNKILIIMWKDISLLLRDRTALILVIAGPLALTLGMGLVTGSFNRSDDAPAVSEIPVAIVDHDDGELAQPLIDLFTGPDLSDLVSAEVWEDEAAALEEVRAGRVAAVIVIPDGFSQSFVPDMTTGDSPAPVALQVYGDPGSPIRAGIVRSIAEEFTARAETGVTTIRLSLTELATSGAVPPEQLPDVGHALSEGLLTGDASTSTSGLIRVRTETAAAGDDDQGFNLLSYFAPAMALLFLMYAVTLGARTLLSERREGTLARMLAAPVTPGQVLGGKVAGIFLGGFIQMAVLILLTTVMFRLNWGNPLGVLLLVVAAALAATGWGLLIASLSSNDSQISAMGMALTLIIGIVSGSFIPGQSFGPVMNAAARLTPNRWALDGFMSLAAGDGLAGIAAPVAALSVMAVVLFVASAMLMRRRQTDLLTG